VIGEPLLAGAVHRNVTCRLPGVARSEVTALGTVNGTALTLAVAAERPVLFTARTLK
jgi:hypothetical protein